MTGSTGAFTLTQEDLIRYREGNFTRKETDDPGRGWRKLKIGEVAWRRWESISLVEGMGSLGGHAYDQTEAREYGFRYDAADKTDSPLSASAGHVVRQHDQVDPRGLSEEGHDAS